MANNIEEMIKNSKCFGLAYDGTVKECKICEVKLKCESKCRMGMGEKPEPVKQADKDEVSLTEEAVVKSMAKEKTKAKTVKKSKEVSYDEGMPTDFKPFSTEELGDMVNQRGGNAADFDKYSSDSIKRMRMIMFIKKSYEK
jgi:hypothetical protein